MGRVVGEGGRVAVPIGDPCRRPAFVVFDNGEVLQRIATLGSGESAAIVGKGVGETCDFAEWVGYLSDIAAGILVLIGRLGRSGSEGEG